MHNQQLVAAALNRYKRLAVQQCFDPVDPDSRPTPKQQEILDDISAISHRYVTAGNQCKPGYSLIKMANGTWKQLKDVQEGDWIVAYDKKLDKQVPSFVEKKWNNGIKPVYRYYTGNFYTDSTDNHKMLQYLGGKLVKSEISKCKALTRELCEIEGIDTVDSKKIELLGYLIGDGCLRIIRPDGTWKGIQFTNTNKEIIQHVANLLESEYYLREVGNGDFFISKKSIVNTQKLNIYVDFIRELGLAQCLAYDKFIPEIVFQQSVETRRKFIAGLIATDGWITANRIGFSTTSKELAVGLVRLYSTLGIHASWYTRYRSNPNHRDEQVVQITDAVYYNKFIRDIKVPAKQGKLISTDKKEKSWRSSKITSSEFLGEMPVYNLTINHPDHIYISDGYYTGNCGKSQLGSRECAWIWTETHPTWKRPLAWGNEPLLLLVVGRTTKQVEEVLWRKISAFVEPGDCKIQRIGNTIQKVVHMPTGNTIVFSSHHADNEAREKLQAYVAHWAWIDEMPRSLDILKEIQLRVQARRGYFLATFTPLVRNDDIRKLIDNAKEPYSKQYKMNMFDNPIYTEEDKSRIMHELATSPESIRNTRLFGEWSVGEQSVYDFDPDIMVEAPEGYNASWRHVEAVDPAISSKFGFTLWAEQPTTGIWYCVQAECIQNILVPTQLVEEMRTRTTAYNIVRRVSDPHEVWYIQQASRAGMTYMGVYKKSERKSELIKNLQQALFDNKIKIAPWCTELISEFMSCQWSDAAVDKIINASSYHLLDSTQYFVDNIPSPQPGFQPIPWEQRLREGNQERIKHENLAKKLATSPRRMFVVKKVKW